MTRLEVFGKQLLDTKDLDPVYVMLTSAQLEPSLLRRWCFAYWCSYHTGFSSWASEKSGEAFWAAMFQFAYNTNEAPAGGRWPRGTERRHFRGEKAVTAVDWLYGHFSSPEAPVLALENLAKPIHFRHVRNAVTVWPQFGPWIAFKVGDMLDRVLNVPVDFSNSDVFMFDSPREAAELWAGETGPNAITRSIIQLSSYLGLELAPPRYDRRVNLQEYETILCKWKSHQSGHYYVGKDIREIRHALESWRGISPTAGLLLEALNGNTSDHSA